MKNLFNVSPYKVLILPAVVLSLCFAPINFASAKSSDTFKVAVVDLKEIVDSSASIKALNTEQRKRIKELHAFVKKAKADLAKQTDNKKKQKMEDSYNKQLKKKKAAIEKAYMKKLSVIDKKITSIIDAESAEYDLVLTKKNVIKGGVNITNDIIKQLK